MKELVIKGEGEIYVTATMDVAPFFNEDIESKFYEVRNSEKYNDFVGFDSPLLNRGQNNEYGFYYDNYRDYCEYDNGERELEKIGYDIEAFRGLIYNDFFTPMYRVKINSLKQMLKKEKERIKGHFKSDRAMIDIHILIIDKLIQTINDCNIWIKLSKGGIAYMVFEKKIKNESGEVSIKDYYIEIQKIMASPFVDKENEMKKNLNVGQIFDIGSEKILTEIMNIRSRRIEQVFNSYLWALATYSISFFLEKCQLGEWITKEVLSLKKTKNESKSFLKLPYEVKYGQTVFTKDSPPVRNYLIAYHLPNDIIGKENGKEVINLKDYFDCLYDSKGCDGNGMSEEHAGQLEEFGALLHSLLEGSFVKENGTTALPQIISRKAAKIAELDLSSWKGELCLLESEGVVICNPKIKIYVSGKELDYDDYWKCIIKGLNFLTGGKTFVQVIHRMLIECTQQYRNLRVEKKLNKKEEKIEVNNIECKISIISNLLSKARIDLSPSMIARAYYARGKFERFIEVTGLATLLKTLETSFNELNGAITNYADTRRQRILNKLNKLSIVFATVMSVVTILLVAIEIWKIFNQ